LEESGRKVRRTMPLNYWGSEIDEQIIISSRNTIGQYEESFVGVMPVRQDIQVLPADGPRQLKLGWKVREVIGVSVINPNGVLAGSKSTMVGK